MTEEVIIEGGYKGNINLKRRSVEIQWTPELVQEYVKCAKDPVYFIEKYMKIISINEGLINFKLYDYQKEMVKSMAENRYTVIATARQAGKSTTTLDLSFGILYLILIRLLHFLLTRAILLEKFLVVSSSHISTFQSGYNKVLLSGIKVLSFLKIIRES